MKQNETLTGVIARLNWLHRVRHIDADQYANSVAIARRVLADRSTAARVRESIPLCRDIGDNIAYTGSPFFIPG